MTRRAQTDYERFEQSSTAARRLLREEELILDVTDTLCEAMDRDGVSRADLARELGKTRGFVSQILDGERNLTLRTVAGVADALGYVVQFRMARDPRGATGHWRATAHVAPDQGSASVASASWATEMRAQASVHAGDSEAETSGKERAGALCLA